MKTKVRLWSYRVELF